MIDLTKIILPAEKLEDGSFSKPMTAAQIIEKAKEHTLNRKEMAALRTVGLKKDGSPVAERSAPDASAVTSEKLAHAIQLVGVDATFAAAFQRAGSDASVKGDVISATRKLLRKLRDDEDETTFAAVVAACARAGVKHIDARLSGGGGIASRAESYAVSKTKRVVVNVADLDLVFDGEKCLSRVTQSLTEVDGVKCIMVRLSDEQSDADEPEAEAGQAALFT